MQHGLGDAKKQQRNAVARGKEHGEPGGEAVLRVGVVWPQLDIAPATESHHNNEHQEECHRQHVEPAEGGGNPGQGRTEQLSREIRAADSADNKQHNHHERGNEHRKQDCRAGYCGGLRLVHAGFLSPHSRSDSIHGSAKQGSRRGRTGVPRQSGAPWTILLLFGFACSPHCRRGNQIDYGDPR